jgi:p25-alpha
VQVTKRMTFQQFSAALDACAAAHGVPAADAAAAVAAAEPRVSGTVAGQVKWHDDRGTYTGVYAHGGPAVVQKGGEQMRLEEMVDRCAAEKRAGRRLSGAHMWAA